MVEVIVVVAGVMVVSGVEAESTTIISGKRYIIDDEVGIGALAGELVSLVRHCTVCLVVELTVTVKVSPARMELAEANKRNTCSSIVRELREPG